MFDFVFGGDFVEHGFEGVVFQWRKIDPLQLPSNAQDGRVAGREVQVRGALFEH